MDWFFEVFDPEQLKKYFPASQIDQALSLIPPITNDKEKNFIVRYLLNLKKPLQMGFYLPFIQDHLKNLNNQEYLKFLTENNVDIKKIKDYGYLAELGNKLINLIKRFTWHEVSMEKIKTGEFPTPKIIAPFVYQHVSAEWTIYLITKWSKAPPPTTEEKYKKSLLCHLASGSDLCTAKPSQTNYYGYLKEGNVYTVHKNNQLAYQLSPAQDMYTDANNQSIGTDWLPDDLVKILIKFKEFNFLKINVVYELFKKLTPSVDKTILKNIFTFINVPNFHETFANLLESINFDVFNFIFANKDYFGEKVIANFKNNLGYYFNLLNDNTAKNILNKGTYWQLQPIVNNHFGYNNIITPEWTKKTELILKEISPDKLNILINNLFKTDRGNKLKNVLDEKIEKSLVGIENSKNPRKFLSKMLNDLNNFDIVKKLLFRHLKSTKYIDQFLSLDKVYPVINDYLYNSDTSVHYITKIPLKHLVDLFWKSIWRQDQNHDGYKDIFDTLQYFLNDLTTKDKIEFINNLLEIAKQDDAIEILHSIQTLEPELLASVLLPYVDNNPTVKLPKDLVTDPKISKYLKYNQYSWKESFTKWLVREIMEPEDIEFIKSVGMGKIVDKLILGNYELYLTFHASFPYPHKYQLGFQTSKTKFTSFADQMTKFPVF